MNQAIDADRILDKALELGEAASWEALRLHDVAAALGVGLDAIQPHFRQKDDLVEAWFDRADRAMLSASLPEDFYAIPERERLRRVIQIWLDALAPHRRLTREMLAYKLEFGHVHLQVLGLLRISRTVQWMREVARRDSTHLCRIVEEAADTALYLRSFIRWLIQGPVQ